MERDKLRQLIGDLHRELSATDSIDADSRLLLEELSGDIEQLVATDAPSTKHRDTASAQLEDAALKFETEHPKLSMVLGEIMDALGKLGI